MARGAALGIALGLALAACTSGAHTTPGPTAPGPAVPAHWAEFRHLAGVVDLAGPRGDGSFMVGGEIGTRMTRDQGTRMNADETMISNPVS